MNKEINDEINRLTTELGRIMRDQSIIEIIIKTDNDSKLYGKDVIHTHIFYEEEDEE